MSRLVDVAVVVFAFSFSAFFVAWITIFPTIGFLWSLGVLK